VLDHLLHQQLLKKHPSQQPVGCDGGDAMLRRAQRSCSVGMWELLKIPKTFIFPRGAKFGYDYLFKFQLFPPKCSSSFNWIFQQASPSIPGPKQRTLLLPVTPYQHHPLSQPVFQDSPGAGSEENRGAHQHVVPGSPPAERPSPHRSSLSTCGRRAAQPAPCWLDGQRARPHRGAAGHPSTWWAQAGASPPSLVLPPRSPRSPRSWLAQLFVQLCGRPDRRSDSGWKEKCVAFCRVFQRIFFPARSVPWSGWLGRHRELFLGGCRTAGQESHQPLPQELCTTRDILKGLTLPFDKHLHRHSGKQSTS